MIDSSKTYTRFYFDIETGPAPDKKPEDYKRKIKAPANYKKEDSIQKWIEENAPMQCEKMHRETSLQPEYGQIVSIAWAWEDAIPASKSIKEGDEESVILSFFKGIIQHESPQFIGHNIKKFDIDFVVKRAIINKIKAPPVLIEAWRKRYSDAVCDTMEVWAGYNKYISQEELAGVLGIDTNSNMDGSEVYDHVLAGKFEEIQQYNLKDVEIVRKIHRRINGWT